MPSEVFALGNICSVWQITHQAPMYTKGEQQTCRIVYGYIPFETITQLIYHSIKPDATETRTSKGT